MERPRLTKFRHTYACKGLQSRGARIRTGDLLLPKQTLYTALSGPRPPRCSRDYRPPAPQARGPYAKRNPARSPKTKRGFYFHFQQVGLGRLELPTSRLSDMSRALVDAGERWNQGDFTDLALVSASQRWWAMIQVVIQVCTAWPLGSPWTRV